MSLPKVVLSNGYEFRWMVAGGALGLDGLGYFWEKPFRWAGLLDPSKFLVTTKTLTWNPRRGNLSMLQPWRAVRPLGGGNFVNCVGLTNPGFTAWSLGDYPKAVKAGVNLAVSLSPEDVDVGRIMIGDLAELDRRNGIIKAVELNVSCPNAGHDSRVDQVRSIVEEVYEYSPFPLVVKLGAVDPFLDIIQVCKQYTEAFSAINAVPWKMIYGDRPSPLDQYRYPGGSGGVSGPAIRQLSLDVLKEILRVFPDVQVISGGGVSSEYDVKERFVLGAKAVAFGTAFLRGCWKPNQIVSQVEG